MKKFLAEAMLDNVVQKGLASTSGNARRQRDTVTILVSIADRAGVKGASGSGSTRLTSVHGGQRQHIGLTSSAILRGCMSGGPSGNHIPPGRLIQSGFAMGFNVRLLDKRLKETGLASVADLRFMLNAWPYDHKHIRPHSKLGEAPPVNMSEACHTRHVAITANDHHAGNQPISEMMENRGERQHGEL